MKIELARASLFDAVRLAHLFQYYVYELSETVGADCDGDGRFASPSIDAYWSDAWRHPHLVHVDEKLAGFALVQKRSRITGDENTWDMAEFFVMRKYQRRGVGTAVATRLFDSFRGRWEVRELAANQRAIAFWRRAIAAYTHGQFEETMLDDERWHGPVQSFRS
jgi:predicted acetyltransferase